MNCKEALALLLDADLAPTQRSDTRLTTHFLACHRCRAVAAQLAAATAALHRELCARQRVPRSRPHLGRWLIAAIAAAACVGMLIARRATDYKSVRRDSAVPRIAMTASVALPREQARSARVSRRAGRFTRSRAVVVVRIEAAPSRALPTRVQRLAVERIVPVPIERGETAPTAGRQATLASHEPGVTVIWLNEHNTMGDTK